MKHTQFALPVRQPPQDRITPLTSALRQRPQ